MKRLGFLAAIVLVLGLAGGCFLSREEALEWKNVKERLASYDKQLVTVIESAAQGRIKPMEAAKQVESIIENKSRDEAERTRLAETRARNIWAGIGLLTNILVYAASQGFMGLKAKRLAASVQAAKDTLWPKQGGAPPAERVKFNSALAASQEASGIRGWVNKLLEG
jgi:predicted aminopeptidase